MSIFKKKEKIAEVSPEAPKVLETGKEVTFRDPKTGEYVYQRTISPEQRKIISQAFQKNSQMATQSIQLSRQRVAVEKAIIENDNKITETEKEINETVQKVREELKIDGRWGLNPNLMILERRDPPEG